MPSLPTPHELTLFNVTGQGCLTFLEAIQPYATNFIWHIYGPLSEENTQRILLDLRDDLPTARLQFSNEAANQNMPSGSWQLLPTRL